MYTLIATPYMPHHKHRITINIDILHLHFHYELQTRYEGIVLGIIISGIEGKVDQALKLMSFWAYQLNPNTYFIPNNRTIDIEISPRSKIFLANLFYWRFYFQT